MKLSDYVAEFVSSLGVKHVFMLTGGGAMHLNDSFGNLAHTEFICPLHEQAAAIAAEAYARVSEGLGVAVVTTGPGGTNTLTGVVAAWLDSTPCLFLSGQVKCADIKKSPSHRQNGVQEVDITSIMAPVTKYSVTVRDASSIRYHLEKAVHLSLHEGRPGPTWLDIPLDIQAAEIDPATLPGYTATDIDTPNTSELKRLVGIAMERMAQAKRPVLLLGNGTRLSGAVTEAKQLVDRLGIPVLTTRLGVDLVEYSHSSLIGMPGSIAPRAANYTLQNCDFLLCLGARMDMALMAYAPKNFAPHAYKVMVNIDEEEITKLDDAIDLPIVANAKDFLVNALEATSYKQSEPRWEQWLLQCKKWKERYPFVTEAHREDKLISVYWFADLLSEHLNEGDIVLPGSSGLACEIFLTAFKAKKHQRIFHNKGTGAMGLGQPAALGACLAANRKRTICIDGDGGFHMNIQELETIKRLQLPIKFFVLDNNGYASIRTSQTGYFGRCTGADANSGVTLPDIEKISQAYGLPAITLATPSELKSRIRTVLESDGPMVICVKTKPDEQREPRVLSVKLPNGNMTSMPLERMWPYLPEEEHSANMIQD